MCPRKCQSDSLSVCSKQNSEALEYRDVRVPSARPTEVTKPDRLLPLECNRRALVGVLGGTEGGQSVQAERGHRSDSTREGAVGILF
jgi:hypothetical protein